MPMHKFVRSFITEWRKLDMPFSGETIVVAVSGGADSMSLMLAIHELTNRKKLEHRVIIAHLNHKLRQRESDTDERYVRAQAKRLGFELVVGSAEVSRKGNLEQAARDARYKFLLQTAKGHGAFAMLTGHTQNDQAETLLFNLIRGSGPDGLVGMRAVRELQDGILLVRPLLSWAGRAATEDYCHDQEVKYRADRMNKDEKYSRVRIRRRILPAMAEINPNIVEALARTADLMSRHSELTGSQPTSEDREKLALKDLKSMKSPDLYVTLRSWLKMKRGNLRALELKHIEAIERLILTRKSGNTVELPGGGRVVKQAGSLIFTNIKVEK